MDIHPWLQHKIIKNINRRAGEREREKKTHTIIVGKKLLECIKRTKSIMKSTPIENALFKGIVSAKICNALFKGECIYKNINTYLLKSTL